MTAALPATARGRPIEVWWQDEARVGQQGTLTRVWAERGSRPPAPRDQRYTWAYLFGAVCPARGIGAGLVLPTANAAMMNLHLHEISTQVSHGAHAVLVLDGAGWHQTGGQLRVPENITLLHLPPYAPEPPRQCLEASGERLGLSARQQAQQPRLRHLREHRRRLL